ncbi:MAG: EamA family transporter, partial [Candidatus Eisenbacteria bacterium]|nr:EamA family transporter [Candidatus Eisenbacteria bacterium]
ARIAIAAARAARGWSLGAGALDSSANAAFWFAVQGGSLAIVSALVNLAPATSVLLARAFLGERWSVPQRFGLAMALAAGLMISLG